jgi:hypothetical protein
MERLKQHWIYPIVVVATASAATAWALCQAVYVEPLKDKAVDREQRIQELTARLGELEKRVEQCASSQPSGYAPKYPGLSNSTDGGIENSGTVQPGPTKPDQAEEAKSSLSHNLDVFKATASTFKQEPMNVLDGNTSLSTWTSRWISADRETEGAWLELHLPEPATVTGVRVFMVIQERFAGGQIRDAELVFSDNSSQVVRFPFKSGWQQVNIRPVRTDLVRIVVKSVYPGQEEGFGVDVFEAGLVGY